MFYFDFFRKINYTAKRQQQHTNGDVIALSRKGFFFLNSKFCFKVHQAMLARCSHHRAKQWLKGSTIEPDLGLMVKHLIHSTEYKYFKNKIHSTKTSYVSEGISNFLSPDWLYNFFLKA